jgi:hypothetical protein
MTYTLTSRRRLYVRGICCTILGVRRYNDITHYFVRRADMGGEWVTNGVSFLVRLG